MTLPTDKQKRKQMPIVRGVLDYFPDAVAEVAHVSYVGNQQHNPGEPMHWARGKSMDQEDCLVRHLMERGTFDDDGIRHSAKVAWRALAILQLEIEADRAAIAEEFAARDSERVNVMQEIDQDIITRARQDAEDLYAQLIQHRVDSGEYDVLEHDVIELTKLDYPCKERTR
jgi:hypothetical protein